MFSAGGALRFLRTPGPSPAFIPSMDIDAEWRDICDGVRLSGLVSWADWIAMGQRDGGDAV